MSVLKTSFENIQQDPAMTKVMGAFERGCLNFGINFFLVGALARDVWLKGIHDLDVGLITRDIDFGVMVKDVKTFEQLKEFMINEEGFVSSKTNAFVIIAPNKMELDLLPFGEIEKKGKVTVKGTGLTTISLDGFKEVYDTNLPEIQLGDDTKFKICTLPGIVLLKFIAWNDRPEIRSDDIRDIAVIMKHFFYVYDEIIWEKHNDLFEEGRELDEIAVRVLGREMGKIVVRNDKLKGRILRILDQNTHDKNNSPIGEILASYYDKLVKETIELLIEIKTGISEII